MKNLLIGLGLVFMLAGCDAKADMNTNAKPMNNEIVVVEKIPEVTPAAEGFYWIGDKTGAMQIPTDFADVYEDNRTFYKKDEYVISIENGVEGVSYEQAVNDAFQEYKGAAKGNPVIVTESTVVGFDATKIQATYDNEYVSFIYIVNADIGVKHIAFHYPDTKENRELHAEMLMTYQIFSSLK